MVVPINKQKTIEEPELDALPLQEVVTKRTEAKSLGYLGTSSNRRSHMVVDLYLKVEIVGVGSLGFGYFVEEVVEEKEVVIEMLEG